MRGTEANAYRKKRFLNEYVVVQEFVRFLL